MALAFVALASPSLAQTSALFPLDHFWTRALEAPFAAPPAADERRVYVPLQTGQFAAFEPGRAEPVWSVELAVDGAPTVAGNRVFAPASGAIHALDAGTGAVIWRLPAGPLAATLAHRAGWLIVALADGALQGVRAEDGVVVWARSMGAPLAAAPGIDGDLLVATFADGRVAAIDVTTGTPRWQRSLGSPAGAATISGDRIFVGSADGSFWSLKTRDGDPDWHWKRGARLIGAPAADAERVYTVALDNVVRAFRRGSGHLEWSHALSTRPAAGPAVIEGLVVITSGDVGEPGLIYIDARTGRAAGKTPPLPERDDTARAQFPIALSGGAAPFALLATATVSGDWQLHAYRQTFIPVLAGPITWGKRYEVRRRLDIRAGYIVWGPRVPLVPPVPRVPRASLHSQDRHLH
ncbi:MAG TPA: PQQ-binding-like beta-propeller repeat protein [Vicinamibacterales bacterium]